jgi:eukaryotic-like serine/threonine-protein kinase
MSSRARPEAEGAPALHLPERYRIRRHLATGGMASVWSAEDLVLGRAVAIKVLAKRFARDEMAVRRFKREARAAARVSNHPHVVTIFDVGDTGSGGLDESDPDSVGQAFIVMEHLTGGTVADALRLGQINRHEALRWLGEAASALDHAHSRGIVHRDIKPANFLLDGSRILHVADFGIARLVSEDTITSSGELFGTAAYLAPEQALGHHATGASDRYALTVAAFELLTGERPFTAQHFAAQARQHIEDQPPSASERNHDLPPAVDPVLARGMAKEPEARYETAGAIVAALEDALSAPAIEGARVVPGAVRGGRAGRGGARAAGIGAAGRPRTVTPRTSAPHRGSATPRTSAPPRGGATPRASAAPGASVTPRRPPPPASTAATAAAAIMPAGRGGHRRGRILALTALVVAVCAVGVIAVAGVGGSGHPASASRRSKTAQVVHRSQRAKRPAPAASSATTANPSSATASQSTTTTSSSSAGSSADQLQATGHQELLNGDYQQAIASLRQAVSAAAPGSLTYAYALYDLGRSLTLSGDPASAIPVLQQRLKIPNQTPVVQQALNQALRADGQAPTPSPSPSPPSTKPAAPSLPKVNSGGAGLAPPGHDHGRGHNHGNGNGHD